MTEGENEGRPGEIQRSTNLTVGDAELEEVQMEVVGTHGDAGGKGKAWQNLDCLRHAK